MKLIIINLIVCAILAWLFTDWIFKRFIKKPDAILNVDTSDPETDHYNLIFLIPIEDISKRKHVDVEVRTDVRK